MFRFGTFSRLIYTYLYWDLLLLKIEENVKFTKYIKTIMSTDSFSAFVKATRLYFPQGHPMRSDIQINLMKSLI